MSTKKSVTAPKEPELLAPVSVTPVGETGVLISMLERMTRDPSLDIDRFTRIYELYVQADRLRGEKEFAAAMAAAQAELEPVVRKTRNISTNKDYADLAAIAEAAQPIIAKHGFSTTYSMGTAARPEEDIHLVCEVLHRGGFSKRIAMDFPRDKAGAQGKVNKTDMQALGSSITYGRRYLKLMAFDIATKDKDGNASAAGGNGQAGPISEEQHTLLRALIDHSGANVAIFCRHYQIEKVSDLPAGRFVEAQNALLRKAQAARIETVHDEMEHPA